MVDTGAVLAATGAPNNTVGRGVALDVADATLGGAVREKKRALWPLLAGSVLLVAGAGALFVVFGNAKEDSDATPPPTVAAAPVPSASTPVADSPKLELETAEPQDEAPPTTEAALPTVEPLDSAESAGAKPPVKGAKKPPTTKKKDEEPAKKPADAWDPNSFGGRE